MKGQAFSLDFILSMFIFFFIMGILFFYLFAAEPSPQIGLRDKANNIANLVVQRAFGSRNILDCNYLHTYEVKSYSDLKSSLNVNPYDFWIEFSNVNSTTCPSVSNSTFGVVASPDVGDVSTVVRIVSVNNTQSQMKVSVYNSG